MKKIKLVLSGSGTRFPIYAGAIRRLEEEGVEIEAVVGTSGGSIIAAAIGSGYSGKQIIKLCKDIVPKLQKLVDFSMISFFQEWGFIPGNKIQKELEKVFVPTFKDIKVPVFITATNFNTEKLVIFSKATHPGFQLARAVRCSMAIPLVFTPHLFEGDYHYDGGVKYNFPIDFFVDQENVLGLYFIDDVDKPRKPHPKGLFAVIEVVSRVISMLIAAKTEDDIQDSKALKVPLRTSVDGLDFSFTPEEVEKIIQEGYSQMDKWIKANPGRLS